MNVKKVNFRNKNEMLLAGRLELPKNQEPHNFVLFAHCFTCTKNLTAIRNISNALSNEGFGVLRFDFTGLGESEGDFENTNFSGNVEDLIAAADFLKSEYRAPTLLIGQSLGGAAVIFAATKIPSVKTITTIGAPSNPIHVEHLFEEGISKIKTEGSARVNLGGQTFTIKNQFLEDLKSNSLPSVVKNLDNALLILHSPQDNIVDIKNAEEIYVAAHHPKSFISLDGADHLLSNKDDSTYVGKVIAGWASRYLDIPPKARLNSNHDVAVSLDQLDMFLTKMKLGDHFMVADEPESVGGSNYGPTPYELISAGLAACTAMTIQMYARRKKWNVKNVEVHVNYGKEHAIDCKNCEDELAKIDTFKKEIKFSGPLTEEQITRLLQIADKCPVHKTLHSEVQIITTVTKA